MVGGARERRRRRGTVQKTPVAGKVTRRHGGAPARPPQAARRLLATIYRAAVTAVDPESVAAAALCVRGDAVHAAQGAVRVTLPLGEGVIVVGAGKGAAGLAAGVERILDGHVVGGLVIVPPGHGRPLRRVEVALGDHPIPDRRSHAATRRLLAVLAEHPRAAVLVVVTGGASSLLARPADGLTLADARRLGAWLLASGLDIGAVNVVRKHCSAVSGGRLAMRLAGRAAAALVLSDVPGDDLAAIGSGPTVPDPSTYADALALVDAAGSARRFPPRVRRHLERGARGEIAETPKPGTRTGDACPTLLVADNATARAAAARAARRAGMAAVTMRAALVGDVAVAARRVAARIRRARAAGAPTTVLVAGGETTVRLGPRPGKGGRNQALAAALGAELARVPGWISLAAGTDGIDGPTDAAGAFADGTTDARARRVRRPLAAALARHDVYPCLAALGDLFVPGPTGTNVADLVLALVTQDRGWRLPPRVIETAGGSMTTSRARSRKSRV
jgi:hydroxypyruvate reductase